MKQIAWDEVMKRLEVASKICNDASPVQVEGPIHVGVDLGTADVVVMAVGSCPRPTDDLRAACEGRGIPCGVVGDAREAPRLALDAIREAYQAVLDMA